MYIHYNLFLYVVAKHRPYGGRTNYWKSSDVFNSALASGIHYGEVFQRRRTD